MVYAMEAEVDAFLGRARNEPTPATAVGSGLVTGHAGHRHGHCTTGNQTITGPITVARPKLRGTSENFATLPRNERRPQPDCFIEPGPY
jgi:putative transposase